MQRTDSLIKTLMLGKMEGRERRRQDRTRWLDGITDSADMNLSKDRKAWHAAVHRVTKSWTRLNNNNTTEQQQHILYPHLDLSRWWVWQHFSSPAHWSIQPWRFQLHILRKEYPVNQMHFVILMVLTLYVCWIAYSCPPLCDPLDCSPPASSVHGISQARMLEWVAIPSSRRSAWPRDWTQVSCIIGRIFTHWTMG